jgi:hypothetical protein
MRAAPTHPNLPVAGTTPPFLEPSVQDFDHIPSLKVQLPDLARRKGVERPDSGGRVDVHRRGLRLGMRWRVSELLCRRGVCVGRLRLGVGGCSGRGRAVSRGRGRLVGRSTALVLLGKLQYTLQFLLLSSLPLVNLS